MADAGEIQKLLSSLNGKHGILGCLLVSPEGGVVSSSLPGDIDVGTLGALSATLFSNNENPLKSSYQSRIELFTIDMQFKFWLMFSLPFT